jgi:hypothetical protein
MAGNKRSYGVVLAGQMSEVPADTLVELRLILKEIAAACDGVPADSPFWTSVASSDLILDVGPWRFVYAIDGPAKKITVKSVKRFR